MLIWFRNLTFLFLIVFWAGASAQHWNPLPKDNTLLYHFRDTLQNRTAFVAAKCDSIRLEGQDSAYYLFRMDALLSTWQAVTGCNNQTIYPYFQAQSDHFWGRKMLISPQGEAFFISSASDTLTLKTTASLGDSWMWNDTVIATVYAVTMEPVLGRMDSLKHIGLSSGDTLVLGKISGLVRAFSFFQPPLPSLANRPILLWGIPELGLGGTLPGLDSIFGFDVGDEFGRYDNYYSYPFGGYRVEWNTHFRIDSIYGSGNGPSFHVWMERNKKTTSVQFGDSQQYFPPGPDTLHFDSAQYRYLNLLPFQSRSTLNDGSYYFLVQSGAYKWALDTNRIVQEFRFGFLLDTCTGYYHADGLMYNSSVEYVSGLGLWRWQENGFDWMDYKTTTCFQTQLGAFESCPPFNTLEIPDPTLDSNMVSIYPVPARSVLTVEWPDSRVSRHITLMRSDGSTVLEFDFAKGQTVAELNVGELCFGLYWLKLEGAGMVREYKKVLVGH